MDQQRITAEVTEVKEKTGTDCGTNVVIDQQPLLVVGVQVDIGGGYNTDLRHPAGGNDLNCPSSC